MSDRNKRRIRGRKEPIIRTRHVLIYTFLIILILMYGSARKEAQEAEAHKTETKAATEETSSQDSGEDKDETAYKAAGKADGADDGKKTGADGTEEDAQKAFGELPGLELLPEDMWCLTLTNESYPLPKDYQVTLKQLPDSSESVDERIYDSLIGMIDAMKQQGLTPQVCSGYRTAEKQKSLFTTKQKAYMAHGKTKKEAYDLAKLQISVPGSGEHCMGLAVDFITSDYTELDAGFAKIPEAKWLEAHSTEYGFILRYPKGKEKLTGISFEPWHFRYVGKKVGEYMKSKDICLEEFYLDESLYG